MGWAAIDLRPLKQQCCDLIDEMEAQFGVVADSEKMQQLDELTVAFPVDHYKLMVLLKSQLLSGNKTTAKKLIMKSIPDVRFRWWIKLIFWPVIFVLRLLGFTFGLIWRVLKPLWRLGSLD